VQEAFCIAHQHGAKPLTERLPRLSDSVREDGRRKRRWAVFDVGGAPWGGWERGCRSGNEQRSASRCRQTAGRAEEGAGRRGAQRADGSRWQAQRAGRAMAHGAAGVRATEPCGRKRTTSADSGHWRRLARRLQEPGLHNARYAGSAATEQTPRRELCDRSERLRVMRRYVGRSEGKRRDSRTARAGLPA